MHVLLKIISLSLLWSEVPCVAGQSLLCFLLWAYYVASAYEDCFLEMLMLKQCCNAERLYTSVKIQKHVNLVLLIIMQNEKKRIKEIKFVARGKGPLKMAHRIPLITSYK